MEKYRKLYEAAVLVKQGADIGSAASKATALWRRLAYEVAPPAVMAAPAAAAGVIGYKGYQKGKRKVEESRLKRQIRRAQKMRYKMGAGAVPGPNILARAKDLMKSDPAKMLGIAATIPVAGAGATALVEGLRRAYYAARKSHDFKGMMSANPDFKTRESRDVRMAFDSLHRLNPQFGREPLVAGAWVRHTLDSALGETGPSVDPQSAALVSGAYKGMVSPAQAAAKAVPEAIGTLTGGIGQPVGGHPSVQDINAQLSENVPAGPSWSE